MPSISSGKLHVICSKKKVKGKKEGRKEGRKWGGGEREGKREGEGERGREREKEEKKRKGKERKGKEGRKKNKNQNKMICSPPGESPETLYPKLKNFPETKCNTLHNGKCTRGLKEN